MHMAQDDVTAKKPLRGGRQRANHIQVHRIEAGLWERENLLKPVTETLATVQQVRTAATIALPVVGAGAVYVAWKVGKSAYGWIDTLAEDWEGFTGTLKPMGNIENTVDGDKTPTMGFAESIIQTFVNILGLF